MPDKLKEKYIALLHDICMIETPSGNAENINKLVDMLERFSAENGYETERFPFEKAGDFLLIKSKNGSTEKPVLLMAHMDTVHKVGAFGENTVTYDGDWMIAPGAMDCKGGIATGLCVMEMLKCNCKRPVYLFLTSDEEVSGRFSRPEGYEIMTDIAKSSVAVFNLEPGVRDKVTVGRKGILKMRVEITGVPAHAGNGYFEGASAIKEAAYAVLEIEGMSQKGGVTYNCGIIRGGSSANVVSAACSMEVDIRVSTTEEMEKAENLMYGLAKKCVVSGTERKVSVITKRPPMKVTEDNLKLLDKWNESAKTFGLPEFGQFVRGGGSDAAYTVLAGVPTLCS
ncbi:MAG: M20/M25/M40 family metallo-hydrolase, partial [Clostridia bacterium]|nr:M20/M25/M40 family metallo-hydrolase [Clostridia bacterium]